jgi:hypothetical protein
MAEDLRHAAGQPTYEVREILDGDAWVDMGILYRCHDYVEAVEFAFDYLGRRDPRRTGAVGGLQVIKNGDRVGSPARRGRTTTPSRRPDPIRFSGGASTLRDVGISRPDRCSARRR